MDYDFVCVRPFDELVHRYSYFSNLEPVVHWSKVPWISRALIAASANNTLLKHIYDDLIKYLTDVEYRIYINGLTTNADLEPMNNYNS